MILKNCVATLVALSVGTAAVAQPVATGTAAAPAAAPAPAVTAIKVPEGTEFVVRLEDNLSSKTTQEGERFTITLLEDVRLADGTLLKAGYRGVGEVVEARKTGMMGKTGKIGIRVSYIKVGDQRIRLRAAKSAQGDHRTGAQVVTVVLVGVFAGFIKGKNTQIPKGTQFSAFADQDTTLQLPLTPPPADL
jgi:hypothetical protein